MLKQEEVGFSVHGYTLEKFSYLEGMVRTTIEAAGLPERQSKSLTDLIVGEIWYMYDHPQFSYDYKGKVGDFDAKMIK